MRWKLSYSSKLLRNILKNIHRKIQSADLKIAHHLWLLSEYIPCDLSLANDLIYSLQLCNMKCMKVDDLYKHN